MTLLIGASTTFTRRRLLVGALAALIAGAAQTAGGASAPTSVPAAPVASFPGNTDPALLADVSWLRDRQAKNEHNLRILDLSSLRDFRNGHIVGAVHAWWQDMMALNYPTYGVVRFEPEPINDARDVIRGWGIDNSTQVAAYDNQRNRYAAAVVWWLRALGHQQATVLDGGLAAWHGAGGGVTTSGMTPPKATDLSLKPDQNYLIGTAVLHQRLHRPDIVIVDVRTATEANDTINNTVKRGRIPGAISIPWTSTLRDQAGRLKPPDQLRQLYANAGITPDKIVVVYGRFGIEAAQSWLVLSLLGYQQIRLYDQGWAQWGATPGLPMAAL